MMNQTETETQTLSSRLKLMFKKFIEVVKKNWKLVVAACASVFGLVLAFKNRSKLGDLVDYADAVDEIKDKHDSKVEEARQDERKQKAKASKELEKELAQIDSNTTKANVELEKKKSKVAKKIVTDAKNDPTILANELSKATGFKVIKPEDE